MTQPIFNPEITLERNEQAALALLVASEGYRVLHKIVRSEIDKLFLDAVNVPSSEIDAARLEKLRIFKAGAMLYEGWTNRINHEVQQYTQAAKPDGPPVDATEGMLDMGEYARRDGSFEEETDANEF